MIKTKTENIAWAGQDFFNRIYAQIIKREFDRETDGFKVADKALEGISQVEYPLIIVSTTIAPGEFEGGVVPGVGIHYPKVSMDLIKEIRTFESYRDTPIIAFGPSNSDYTPSQRYLDAGATEVYEGLEGCNKDFRNLVRGFLG